MDPVSQFRFACPVCGQHLQARADEAGRTTQCPSCFKKLIVPQAPTDGGGKLLITAALAGSRRSAGVGNAAADHPPLRPAASPDAWSYALRALVVVLILGGLWAVLRTGVLDFSDRQERPPGSLWTDQADQLSLPDFPVRGSLNGWEFSMTEAVWRDTQLILRQDGGQPDALRLELTFPLRGGELVPGKTFRLGPNDPPFATPPLIQWKDDPGTTQSRLVHSGYILWIEFGAVSEEGVSGRLHLCISDAAKSWVAGRFSAVNRTRIRKPG